MSPTRAVYVTKGGLVRRLGVSAVQRSARSPLTQRPKQQQRAVRPDGRGEHRRLDRPHLKEFRCALVSCSFPSLPPSSPAAAAPTAPAPARRRRRRSVEVARTPVATTAVDMKNLAFSPRAIKVASGATVTWTNSDVGTDHNVTFDGARPTHRDTDFATGTAGARRCRPLPAPTPTSAPCHAGMTARFRCSSATGQKHSTWGAPGSSPVRPARAFRPRVSFRSPCPPRSANSSAPSPSSTGSPTPRSTSSRDCVKPAEYDVRRAASSRKAPSDSSSRSS